MSNPTSLFSTLPLRAGRPTQQLIIIKPCLPGGVALINTRPLGGTASIINTRPLGGIVPIETRRPRSPSSVAPHQHSAQPGGIPTGLGRNKCVWLCSKLLSPRGTDAVYKYLPRNSSADLLFR